MLTALGIDVGTTNTKVVLVDVGTGRALAVASAPTPPAALLGPVLDDLLARVLPAGPAPAAVGIASMAETGVVLGPDDEPRGDWLRWDGHRAGAQADRLAATLGRAELFAATGVRASAKVPLATWAWLREHRPDALHAGGRWAGAADLVALRLTGALVTDHTLAGRTMAYRLGRPGALPAGLDPELLAAVALTSAHVPRVLAPGESVPTRAGLPHLAAGLPVTVAGHDHAVGAFAAGVRAPGQVADSVGTAEVVCTVLAADPAPAQVAAAGMSLVRTVRGDLAALVAGSSSAGGAVTAWLERVVGPGDGPASDERASDERARRVADLLRRASVVDDELVRAVGPGAEPFVVLPYVHGRQTPHPDPSATLRPVGAVPADPVAAVRGVLLGAVLHARWMLEEQSRLAGRPPVALRALGGPLIANPAWAALKRWCSPVPVDLVAEGQAVAAGAALLAAERAGLVEDAPELATSEGPTDPRQTDPRQTDPVRLDPETVRRLLERFVAAATGPA
ncbi:FGGY-family carbohydrate kinase [Cellulomonas composti]|uniref:Xylulokinase n=1 Tax=Cellulomonas composti TaxID=266130 RepID=A0A511J7S6_9CELL|nr:FGGY family carbohydrate kinase [Cellulomonas composti]GEL94024.1 xylulokinase [Cellulomonas composti]